MVNSSHDAIAKFPGPITLVPSRAELWLMIFGSGLMIAASIFVTIISVSNSHPDASIGVAFGIVGTVFFGAGTAAAVIALQPGASSLRLYESCFEVTHFYRTERFSWDQVSDFAVWRDRFVSIVVFRAAQPYLSVFRKMGADMCGGRNGWLPDTYGFSAHDLARLMTAWQHLAISAAASTDGGDAVPATSPKYFEKLSA
jgi:hypothetical protein